MACWIFLPAIGGLFQYQLLGGCSIATLDYRQNLVILLAWIRQNPTKWKLDKLRTGVSIPNSWQRLYVYIYLYSHVYLYLHLYELEEWQSRLLNITQLEIATDQAWSSGQGAPWPIPPIPPSVPPGTWSPLGSPTRWCLQPRSLKSPGCQPLPWSWCSSALEHWHGRDFSKKIGVGSICWWNLMVDDVDGWWCWCL